jgi:hypothetical protein
MAATAGAADLDKAGLGQDRHEAHEAIAGRIRLPLCLYEGYCCGAPLTPKDGELLRLLLLREGAVPTGSGIAASPGVGLVLPGPPYLR